MAAPLLCLAVARAGDSPAIPDPASAVAAALAQEKPDAPLPQSGATPPPGSTNEERMAAAKSVKVRTDILGIELGSDLGKAREKLDKLADPATAKAKKDDADKKDGGSGGDDDEDHKEIWQLAGTEFRAVFIKADDKERIIYITGWLRPEKELPFGEIGELSKAPVLTDHAVAWDVLRPGQPLFRVAARGAGGSKAAEITLLVVQRQKPNVKKE